VSGVVCALEMQFVAWVTSLSQCLFTCTCCLLPVARCSDSPSTPRPRKRFPISVSSKINMPKNIHVSQGPQRRLPRRPTNQAPGTPRARRSPFEATKYARVDTTWQSRDGLTSKRSRSRAWAFGAPVLFETPLSNLLFLITLKGGGQLAHSGSRAPRHSDSLAA